MPEDRKILLFAEEEEEAALAAQEEMLRYLQPKQGTVV
jgi:hypothetical protein